MSSSFQFVVDEEATLDEAPALAKRVIKALIEHGVILPTPQQHPFQINLPRYTTGPNAHLVTESISDCIPCGLDIEIGRQVYCQFEGGTQGVSCPACGHYFDFNELAVSEAAEAWFKKMDDSVKCRKCKKTNSIAAWRFDPNWGFGNLAFKFSEWILHKDFVEYLQRKLGHRVSWVDCMI